MKIPIAFAIAIYMADPCLGFLCPDGYQPSNKGFCYRKTQKSDYVSFREDTYFANAICGKGFITLIYFRLEVQYVPHMMRLGVHTKYWYQSLILYAEHTAQVIPRHWPIQCLFNWSQLDNILLRMVKSASYSLGEICLNISYFSYFIYLLFGLNRMRLWARAAPTKRPSSTEQTWLSSGTQSLLSTAVWV